MEQNTLEITERSEVFEFASLRNLVNQALQQNFGETPVSNGISSGFKDLDQVIKGFKKGQLITVGVKPGMGKTAFMLSIANNIAIKNKHSIAIFSPERSSEKITNRLIESETGMSLKKLMHGNLKPSERDHMFSLISYIANANVFLDDTPEICVEDLLKKARQLKLNHSIELIIIDYLELLSLSHVGTENRQEQLSTAVHNLKEMARELNVPVLLFSQLNGQYNAYVDDKPTMKNVPVFLSELSDVVMFLHRTDLYPNGNGNHDKDLVDIIIGKYNNEKSQSTVKLRFIESLAKFTDK